MKMRLVAAGILAVAVLSGCSDSDAVPDGDPAKTFGQKLRGYAARPGVVIGRDLAAYWAQSVLSGFRETGEDDMPARLSLVATLKTCKFRAPRDGEVVANVHVDRGTMPTPIYAFSRDDLADRTKTWIDVYKREGENARSSADPAGDKLRAVDVVVTETSGPVYLVLQNEWSSVVWNIQAAPGVKIAHVAVLGSGSVGIANLGESVPAEFMNGDVLKQCKIVPARLPADHWLLVQRVKDGSSDDLSDKLAESVERHGAYSRWFAANFGMQGENGVIGINEASHVLVGPLPASPDQRVVFKPLEGASVRIAREDYVTASSRADYRARHDELVRTLAEKMVGGDLKSLHKGS